MKRLVVLSLLITIGITFIPVGNANSEISGTPPSETGDTLISNTTIWKNETITLNGNLTVDASGNLTLDNVTLIMNCSFNGQYWIEVNGGELYIYNNSNITSANPNYHYCFDVLGKSKLVMENTSLSGCGYYQNELGLSICTDDAWIKNCTIEKNYCGIYLSRKGNVPEIVPKIENNIIKNNLCDGIRVWGELTAPYIANNTITLNDYGIKCEISGEELCKPPYITNNVITLNNYGIKCRGDFSTITGNTISNNNIGIYCNRSHARIENNDLSFNSKGIEYVEADPKNRAIVIMGNNIENSDYGIFCSEDPIIDIRNNEVKNSSISGIEIYNCGGIVEENNLTENKIGIKCSIDASLKITENNINNSANEGIYCYNSLPVSLEIEENNIKNGVGPGIYCYDSPSYISKNTLSNNSWGIRLLGESAMLSNTIESNRDGRVWQEWTIGAAVKNEAGDAVANATVRAKDCFGHEIHVLGTDEEGCVSMNLTEYKTFNNDDRIDYNPYNIASYKENVGRNSTVVIVTRDLKIYPVLRINKVPVANITVSATTGYTNEPIVFDATNSYDAEEIYDEIGHGIVKYFWDFGDGNNATGKIVSHTYLENGTYNVTLTVWDKENATNTTWMLITVGIRPQPLPTWLELYYKQVFLVVAMICCLGAVFFSGKWYIQAKKKEKEVELWVEKKASEKEEKMKKLEQRIKEWGEKQQAKKKVKEENIESWAKRKEEKKRAMEEKLREWAERKEEEKKKVMEEKIEEWSRKKAIKKKEKEKNE